MPAAVQIQHVEEAVSEANPFPVKVTEAASYYSTGYTLNPAGELVSETESNGIQTRTRTWSYATDGGGNTNATASNWSYL